MKKYIFTAALTAASLFSLLSCNKEIDTVAASTSNGPSIECYTPDDSKTYVDGVSVKWNSGDIIYVIDTDDKTKKTYTTEDEGSTRATFTVDSGSAPAFDNGTEVVIYSKSAGFDALYDKYWIFDIPQNPSMANSLDPTTLITPMAATGTISDSKDNVFAFKHLTSLVCFDVKNTYSEPITINKIEIDADNNFGWRGEVIYPNIESEKSYWYSYDVINISGTDEIAAGETHRFYCVFLPGAFTNFKVSIYDSESNAYDFNKSSLDITAGVLHKFDTKLNDSSKRSYKYQISYDGGTPENYDVDNGFTKTPTTSVKLLSLVSDPISNTEFQKFMTSINGLSSYVQVDLSEMPGFTTWSYDCKASKISDIYLPSTVTKISGYAHFNGSPYIKLHIHNTIQDIDYIQCARGVAITDGYGFFVDADHTKYKSVNGWLYSADGKTLYQGPDFSEETDVVIPEGVEKLVEYTISNNDVPRTYTLPSTLTQLDYMYYLRNVHTIFFKSVVPPTLTRSPADCPATVQLVVPDYSYDDYVEAYDGKIGTWTIVKESKYIPPTSTNAATISNLDSDNSYNDNLWN